MTRAAFPRVAARSIRRRHRTLGLVMVATLWCGANLEVGSSLVPYIVIPVLNDHI
jgi:hypothetical protein